MEHLVPQKKNYTSKEFLKQVKSSLKIKLAKSTLNK